MLVFWNRNKLVKKVLFVAHMGEAFLCDPQNIQCFYIYIFLYFLVFSNLKKNNSQGKKSLTEKKNPYNFFLVWGKL